MSSFDNVMKKHHVYKDNIARWKYYYNSYHGGLDYKAGGYLRKYLAEEKEGNNEYGKRIMNTPLDNHCRNVVDIYSSFIWREAPIREYGSLSNDPAIDMFLDDADLDGKSIDAVMREATKLSNIYGHCLAIVDKPAIQAATRAEEIAQEIRPYISLFTPENIFDWDFDRKPNGKIVLSYLKVCEYEDKEKMYVREWTADFVKLYEVDIEGEEVYLKESIENPLGVIPAVFVYSEKTHIKGLGRSTITDVSDVTKAIYNELSELEQVIRISNHPTLVMTEGVDASAGAGSVIVIEDTDIDPSLKPYLLQPSSQSIESIINSINMKVEMIDRMSHLSSMRSTVTNTASGISLKIEREMLNTKLATMADNLELAEEQIWDLYAMWQGVSNDSKIEYPNSFDIRDTYTDLDFYIKALATGVNSDAYKAQVYKQIARIVVEDDDEIDNIIEEIENGSQAPQFGANLNGNIGTDQQA